MRTAVTALVLVLTLASSALAVDPQAAGIAPLIEEGTAARQRGDWAAADAAYRRALDLATAQGDTQWQYRSWFYIGLVKQVAAEAARDAVGKRALLEEAREPYRTALGLNPKSKSVRINLSEIEWFLGDRVAAIALLEGAQPSPDIAEKLGDAYRDDGRSDDAARAYTTAAEQNADSVTVHEKLMAVLLEGDEPLGGPLTTYLGALVQRRQIDRAIDGAAQTLAHARLSKADGRAARTLLAAALAQKDYDSATFRESAVVGKIRTLVAAGSAQSSALQMLVYAYDGTIESESSFRMWEDHDPVGTGLPSPLSAFRAVLRSIGSTLSRKLEHDKAAAYYRLALSLGEDRVDPAAVRALASIYASQGSYKQLSSLDEKYQPAMSDLASASGDNEDVYEYFRLMGRVETSLEPDGTDTLHRFEQARAAGGGMAEPQLYEQLSLMYDKLGQTHRSNVEKFAAATAYKRLGNLQQARTTLAGIGHTIPDGVDDDDYKRMVHQLVWIPDTFRDKVPSDHHFTIKRDVLLLCAGSSKDDRAKAVAELKDLGITVDARERDLYLHRRDGQVVRTRFFLPVSDPPQE